MAEASSHCRHPLAALGSSVLLASLGTSIANVGLPTLADHFGTSAQQVQWVVIAYLVATTALIVGAGKLGDLFGRRRMLLVGIVVFTLTSATCAMATSLPLLIAARGVQGAGAALMLALSMALIGDSLPRGATGRAMGFLGAMSAVGTALGPSVGGALLAVWGWRALFVVSLPLGTVAALLVVRWLRPDGRTGSRQRFDLAGTLTLAGSLSCYSLSMTLGGGWGTRNWLLLAVTLVGMLLFLSIEKRSVAPLVDLRLLSQPLLRTGLVLNTLVATVVMATLVIGPFYLAAGLGLGVAAVGAVMSVGPAVAALAGVPAGRLVDRLGAPAAATVGLGAAGLGALLLSALPAASGAAGYAGALALLTAGYALFQSANNTAVMATAGADQHGVVSGLLGLARNIGLVTGASAMGALYAAASTASPDTGLHATFAAASALIGVAFLIQLSQVLHAARRDTVEIEG